MRGNKFYVYGHYTESGTLFYIGVGTIVNFKTAKVISTYPRAYHFGNRNKFWNHVKDKHGLVVKILSHHKTKEDSLKEEEKLVSKFGRRILEQGELTNISSGGEVGPVGRVFKMSVQQKKLLSKIKSHIFYVYSKEGKFLNGVETLIKTAKFCGVTKNAISSCFKTKNYTNGFFVFRDYQGDVLDYTAKDLDFKSPLSTKVISEDLLSGVKTEHESISDCAKFLNRSRSSVRGALKRKNGTCNKQKIYKNGENNTI